MESALTSHCQGSEVPKVKLMGYSYSPHLYSTIDFIIYDKLVHTCYICSYII
jgi:hypothetical protein